jgi:DNA polymerase-3 subunit epsilon
MARRKFPGSPASLDALCKRFEIDLSKRDKHGALLDAELLGHVYIELLGGRQKSLDKTFEKGGDTRGDMNQGNSEHITAADSVKDNISIFPKREFAPSPEETEKHHAFIQTIKDAIWNNF